MYESSSLSTPLPVFGMFIHFHFCHASNTAVLLFTSVETVCAKSLQSCRTLCDLIDCSRPGSPVHGIFPTRTQEWVAMPVSGGLPSQGLSPCLLHLLCGQAESVASATTRDCSALHLCPTLGTTKGTHKVN